MREGDFCPNVTELVVVINFSVYIPDTKSKWCDSYVKILN